MKNKDSKSGKVKKIAMIFAIAAIILLIVVLLITSNGGKKNNVSQNDTETVKSEDIKVVFDIPTLIKEKTVDGIIRSLGKPNFDDTEPTKLQLQVGVNEWNKEYVKDGLSLLVTYYTKDRTIEDLFISANDKIKNNLNTLLKSGNLNESSNDYFIQPVYTHAEHELTGIKVMSSTW